MDHSTMDHSHMGHGDMGGMPAMCNMNMLFTWDSTNLCIVFRWWHIRSTLSLILSLLMIVLLVAGYEALRSTSRRYEDWVAKKSSDMPNEAVTETTPFLWTGRDAVEVSKKAHTIKALLYAFQNFYAFMIMLLFMTYNGWVMIAVAVGAFVGFMMFGGVTAATKDNACH